MKPITLSKHQIKNLDRVGGANLILDWPEGLPKGKPMPENHERRPTPAEKAAALAMVMDACKAAYLAPVGVRVVSLRRPHDYPRADEVEQHLAVRIIGQRWAHIRSHKVPRDMWPQPTQARKKRHVDANDTPLPK